MFLSYSSYTKSSGHELAPLLRESASPPPPRRPSPMNIQLSCTALAPPPLKAGGAKICPVTSKNSLPKNAYMMPKDKKPSNAGAPTNSKAQSSRSAPLGGSSSSASKVTSAGECGISSVAVGAAGSNCKPHSSASSRSFPLFSNGSNSSSKLISLTDRWRQGCKKLIKFRSTILQRRKETSEKPVAVTNF